MIARAALLLLLLGSCTRTNPTMGDLAPADLAAVTHDLAALPALDQAMTADLARAAPSRWLMGYYAGYEQALVAPDALDWSALTHVAVAFYLPKSDGTLDTSLDQANATTGATLAKAVVDAAHAHGVKALVSIGGGDSRASFVAACAHMGTFVPALVALLSTPGFDGIDLDWEPIDYAHDGPQMKALVDGLRAAAPTALLTMPVLPLNSNAPADLSLYAGFADELDQLNIQTYGMAGAFSGWKSWHSSALYATDPATPESVDGNVKLYLAAGIPADKLGVGTGAYGLCYTSPVTAPLEALGGTTVSASGLSYATIAGGYAPLGTASFDAAAHVPYVTLPSDEGPAGAPKCRYVSYEDPRSIADKAAYVKAKGLGGAIVWTIGKGHVGSTDPLLDAYATAFAN